MKPIILITSYFVNRNEIVGIPIRGKRDQDFAICTFDYINAIEQAGGVPLVAPAIADPEAIEEMMKLADGILFTGGEDVHPSHYGEDINAGNLFIVEERDSFELRLAELALQGSKPLLGICRGMQLLNVAAGGTLHQDLDTSVRHTLPNAPKEKKLHGLSIVPDTRLYDIYGVEEKEVNSFHHQAVKELAKGFIPTAYAADGIVEAFESTGDRFVIGVQWHPEMLREKNPEELCIFRSFVESAKK